MGDPKKPKKQYNTPAQVWNTTRIENDKKLVKAYGLKNMTELWRMQTVMKRLKEDAKKLNRVKTKQSEIEKQHLLTKLNSFGFIDMNASLGDILGLDLKDVLERRLQSVVFRIGYARGMKQARQFITHGHVSLDGKKLTVPSYLVKKEEEKKIGFVPRSSLSKEDHPERAVIEKDPEKEKIKAEKKAKREEAMRRGRGRGRRPVRRIQGRQAPVGGKK